MTSKALNRSLHAAKATKQDEFYTQLSDIEKEIKHYTKHFKGKIVLCNCDDPKISNFFHYFSHKYHTLGLKKLITTCYKNVDPDIFSRHEGKRGLRLIYNGEQTQGGRVPALSKLDQLVLEEDGDFRSDECIELLKQADIVVTNPPFSLFREYVEQLVKYKKKFIIIGNQNAITYKEVFRLIKDGRLWFGYSHPKDFVVPDYYQIRKVASWRDENGTNWRSFGNVCWFTNLDIVKRHVDLVLYKKYTSKEYPQYDNYQAIEITKVADIPLDYDEPMGVPVTFLDKHNPNQFDILGITDRGNAWGLKTKEYTSKEVPNPGDLNRRAVIKVGKIYKATYARLLIRRKK